MASVELRHRTKEEEDTNNSNGTTRPGKPNKKSAMAKRGLRSLALAIAVPLSLTILDITFFGSSQRLKPSYLPPMWALHLASLGSAALMGLSAWMVWVDGGFHKNPSSLMVYLGQLGLSLAWGPVVLGLGANWVGLVLCAGLVAALVGCSRMFRVVNPIAGHLVKPCLVSAGLLAITNLRLVSSHV